MDKSAAYYQAYDFSHLVFFPNKNLYTITFAFCPKSDLVDGQQAVCKIYDIVIVYSGSHHIPSDECIQFST